MNSDDLEAIRQQIDRAKRHETETGKLSMLLTEERAKLHRAIRLPEQNSTTALMSLVVNYIDSVPVCMAAIQDIANEAGICEYTDIFLNIARDFFFKPPKSVDSELGLIALMAEAYLAHRLMEEINDRFIGHAGIPLAPMDMTTTNLVIHQLIGEDFANELDLAVQFALEICNARESVFKSQKFQDYVRQRRKDGHFNLLDDWPCMAEDTDIYLEFDSLSDYLGALAAGSGSGSLH